MTDWKNHSTFCAIPWSHQLVDTDGKVQACCFFNDHYSDVTRMREDWNSDYMKDLRSKLVSGTRPAVCNRCWKVEDGDGNSPRKARNEWWTSYEDDANGIVDRSITNDFHVDVDPSYFEIRLGNLCNLKCKMCWARSSTQLVKDAKDLRERDPARYFKYQGHTDNLLDLDYDWYDNPEAWKQIEAVIPSIQRISFTGGEPTMIKQYIPFLQMLVDTGHAAHIDLDFCTNLTNISPELVAPLRHFRTKHVTFSVDATGDVYEYIRFPGRWPTIKANMIKFLQLVNGTGVECYVNMVAQIYNILTLPEHIEELIAIHREHNGVFDKFAINISLAATNLPIEVRNIPVMIKRVALHKLDRWEAADPVNYANMTRHIDHNAIVSIRHQLVETDADSLSAATVLDYTDYIDQNKKAKMADKLPELYRLLTIVQRVENG